MEEERLYYHEQDGCCAPPAGVESAVIVEMLGETCHGGYAMFILRGNNGKEFTGSAYHWKSDPPEGE